jgi:hypothetical protein
MDESALLEKLRKVEALFAGATTIGERQAAQAAIDRITANGAARSPTSSSVVRWATAGPSACSRLSAAAMGSSPTATTASAGRP